MKIAIDIGHNCPPDTGAVGIAKEDTLTMSIGEKVIALLDARHEIIRCLPASARTVTDSLKARVTVANRAKANLFVSIHFNAFNGKASGSEVFALSDAGRTLAASVQQNLVALGFKNRGVKNGAKLYVIRHTNCPAILVECCFIDSPDDMKLYNPDKIANAIAFGIEEWAQSI